MALEELFLTGHMVEAHQGRENILAVAQFEAQDLVDKGKRGLLREQAMNHIGFVNDTNFFRFLEGFQ